MDRNETTVRQNGFAIRALRERAGLTVDQLANLVVVSRPYLSHLENETKTTPSLRVISRIAKALDVSPFAIICDRGLDLERAA